MEGTHLSMCLNVSPASKDFCGETLQLLEQLSLPQKQRSDRYVPLLTAPRIALHHDRQVLHGHSSRCRHHLMQGKVLPLPGHQQHQA